MADRKNVARHAHLAEAVALVLRLAGHDAARPTPRTPRRRLSDAFAADAPDTAPRPDVDGLPAGWYLDVTSADPGRWGPALDSTRNAAALVGARRGVLVAYRQARPIADAYAVLSVGDLADLLAEREGAAP